MIKDLFDTTWGRVRLWCSSISTENGRTQVVHELATTTSADEFPVSDRGPAPRKVTCALLFDEMAADPTPPLERFETFKAQVDSGAEELFTHPIEGSFFVHVENFTYEIDDDSNIVNASVVFIAAGEIQPIAPARSASAALSGTDSVSSRADALSDFLDEAGIDSTIPADAKTAVDSWANDDTIPTRDILSAAADINAAIDALINDHELEADLALWDSYQAAILLKESFRIAAGAATSETESVFVMRIAAPTSVLGLVTRVYGGAEASTRERQFRALNDVRAPHGLLQPGDEYTMPGRSSRVSAF